MTWLSWRNLAAQASVTATRELANMPVTRLLNPVAAERYRAADLSAGDTRTTVMFEWATAVRPEFALYMRLRRRASDEELSPPSFAATDLVRHRISTTNAHAGDVYDSGDIASGIALGKGYHAAFIPAPVTPPGTANFASFEFDALSRDTTPENFVDWGFCWYGAIDFEPEIDYAGPAVFGVQEGAVRQTSWDNSALRIRRKRNRRRWRLVFRNLRYDTERQKIEEFLDYAGDGGRFIIGLDRTNLADNVMIAALDSASWSRTARKIGQVELPLIEAF